MDAPAVASPNSKRDVVAGCISRLVRVTVWVFNSVSRCLGIRTQILEAKLMNEIILYLHHDWPSRINPVLRQRTIETQQILTIGNSALIILGERKRASNILASCVPDTIDLVSFLQAMQCNWSGTTDRVGVVDVIYFWIRLDSLCD